MKRQVAVPVCDRGEQWDGGCRADRRVEDLIMGEVKVGEKIFSGDQVGPEACC